MKETFIMRTEFLEYMEELSDEDVGKLMRAVFTYEATDEVPEKGSLPPTANMLFKIMRKNLDYCDEKYNEKRKTLSKNGKKGGRPKKNANDGESIDCEEKQLLSDENQKKQMVFEEKQNDFSKSKKSLYVVVNDNDNVVVNAAAVANAPAADNTAAAADDKAKVKSLYEEIMGKGTWNSHVEKTLFGFGLPPEIICYAITEAGNNNVLKLGYIKKILDDKKRAGITGIARARARPEKSCISQQALLEMQQRIKKYGEETKP